jgi:uncharacterized protein
VDLFLFNKCVEELMAHGKVTRLQLYKQHGVTTRLEHCVSVAFLSFRIARKFRTMDANLVARAGLLHDFYFWEKKPRPKGRTLNHPEEALKNAEGLIDLCAKSENIILSHMFPSTKYMPRCKEAWVVIIADKCCALVEYALSLGNLIKRNKFRTIYYNLLTVTEGEW